MGDYTGASVHINGAPQHIRTAVREMFTDEYGPQIHNDDENDTMLALDGSEVRCGASAEIAARLDTFIKEGVSLVCKDCPEEGVCPTCGDDGEVHHPPTDFAYVVSEDPKYEWLGDVFIHVPGLPDFTSAGADSGQIVLKPDTIMEIANNATTLAEAQLALLFATGTVHEEAFSLYEAPTT